MSTPGSGKCCLCRIVFLKRPFWYCCSTSSLARACSTGMGLRQNYGLLIRIHGLSSHIEKQRLQL